jgi:cytoskeletal protein RodZ
MTKSELHNKIGQLLKLERERQDLTLADLSMQLKISKGHLEHIEAGKADALPSELYFNLFAKSYAETLGIDYSRTVEAIKEEVGEPLEPQGSADNRKAVASGSTKPDVRPKAQKTNNKPVSGTKYLKTWIFMFVLVVVLFFFFLIATKILAVSIKAGSPTEEPTKELAGSATPIDKEGSAEADIAGFDDSLYRYRPPSGWQLNTQPVDWRDPISGCISQVKIDRINVDSFLSSDRKPLSRLGGE